MANFTGDFISIGTPAVSSVTYYRLRGYRPTHSDFETWTGTSATTPNPSGESITDVVVVATWVIS